MCSVNSSSGVGSVAVRALKACLCLSPVLTCQLEARLCCRIPVLDTDCVTWSRSGNLFRPHCLSTKWGSGRTRPPGLCWGGRRGDDHQRVSHRACCEPATALRPRPWLTHVPPTQCLEGGTVFNSPHFTAEETEVHWKWSLLKGSELPRRRPGTWNQAIWLQSWHSYALLSIGTDR